MYKISSDLVHQYQVLNYELWLLGDFNIDMLKRSDSGTVSVVNFLKSHGLRQLIDTVTRPNKKKGSCIDLIITDCTYISESGVLNDYVSDHYSIFCVRKKPCERKDVIVKSVRDYRAFDEANLKILLNDCDWQVFYWNQNPDVHWEIILKYINDILSIMCPYKKVTTRKHVTPWLNPDIYKAIKDKQHLVKSYKISKNPDTLIELRKTRNRVNTMIEKAKRDYIISSLNQSVKKTKRFWKLIKCLIDPDDCVEIPSYLFRSEVDNHDCST